MQTASRQTQLQLSTAHSLYNRPATVQHVIHQLHHDDPNAGEPLADPPIGQPFPSKRRKPRRFELNDKVLLWTETVKTGNAKKNIKNWRGPYTIVHVISPIIYLIRLSRTTRKPKITHVNRLKPFFERSRHN